MELGLVPHRLLRIRDDPRHDLPTEERGVEKRLGPHELRHLHGGAKAGKSLREGVDLALVKAFGADSGHDLPAHVAPLLQLSFPLLGDPQDAAVREPDLKDPILLDDRPGEEVHLRASDEAGHEHVDRPVVQRLGGVYLLNLPAVHDDDAGPHRHGLGLVVGHVDEGRLQAVVQLGDLRTHLDPQFGVQVREGLVHQEDPGLADDDPPQGDALALTARERPGLSVEQVLDAQYLRRRPHALFDDVPGDLAELQAERHVVVDGHMRVEGVVLEHHGDVPVLGAEPVHQGAVDVELPLADVLEPGDHPQGGALSAAGGSDQHDELPVVDGQVEVLDGDDAPGIDLLEPLQFQTGHGVPSTAPCPCSDGS